VKLPSHTTVIAYLALFVALGGSAYAAIQLPKNSVGPKQLKANAVTTAKIKNGAVTGAKISANSVTGANIDESTLGRVPSAASAEKATTAGHAATATNATNAASAAEAKALGGIPSSGFLQTNAVQFGSGALNACFAQTLIDMPGWFRITTVGDCKPEFKLNLLNQSSETWQYTTEVGTFGLGPGSSTAFNFSGNLAQLFAVSEENQTKHAFLDCAYQGLIPARIFCSARLAPAS